MSNLPPKKPQPDAKDTKTDNEVSRIRLACAELENALEMFNAPDPESAKREAEESQKIQQIHSQLSDIRRQIDDLSK